jgi:outer membrane protein OmpA-like peptidoglycan-associated protein
MARLLAILMLFAAAPAWAGVEFGARLEQSFWTVSSAPDACELRHEIPRYGVARFHARAGHELAFRLDTDLSGASGRTARLVLVPPNWRHDLRPRHLADVGSEARVLSLDRATTLELYHALETGYQLSVEHPAPGAGGFQVVAAVSTVRFRDVLADFVRCRDGMIQLDFRPVAEWRVHFETNLSRLDAPAHETLREVLNAWRAQRHLRVIVAGHADVRGGDAINDPLSRRRAEAVRTFLDVYGIPRNRIELRSFGSTWPLDPNDGEAAWALNRRATVWLAP